MCLEETPDFLPCAFNARQFQRIFRPAEQMVGQDGDPYMGVASFLLPVIERTKAEFPLEKVKCRLDTREHYVDKPYFIIREIPAAGPQMIAAVKTGIFPVFIFVS